MHAVWFLCSESHRWFEGLVVFYKEQRSIQLPSVFLKYLSPKLKRSIENLIFIKGKAVVGHTLGTLSPLLL